MTDALGDGCALPSTLRWHDHRVIPPYRDDPQDEITTVLRQPGFHEPSDEERDTVCRGTWSRYHCLTHDQPWWHGGVHCPSHHHHEVAHFCGAHGLEVMWPQPLMTAKPDGFDPPLSAVQLEAVDAAWNDEG